MLIAGERDHGANLQRTLASLRSKEQLTDLVVLANTFHHGELSRSARTARTAVNSRNLWLSTAARDGFDVTSPFDLLLADIFNFTSANNELHISEVTFKTRCR
jgi:hypothetical protein